MDESPQNDDQNLTEKLNRETAKINWLTLEHYQQEDAVIAVASGLDLVAVACEFARDNSEQVKTWLEQSRINKVTNEQAQVWKAEEKEIWAVVVAPWVLVQDKQLLEPE